MRLASKVWLHSRRHQPGQGMVEFALVAPLCLLFIFGIIQVALLYFINSALSQAATYGSHVVSAKSSSGSLDSNGEPNQTQFLQSWQGDGPALTYLSTAHYLSYPYYLDLVAPPGTGYSNQATNSVNPAPRPTWWCGAAGDPVGVTDYDAQNPPSGRKAWCPCGGTEPPIGQAVQDANSTGNNFANGTSLEFQITQPKTYNPLPGQG